MLSIKCAKTRAPVRGCKCSSMSRVDLQYAPLVVGCCSSCSCAGVFDRFVNSRGHPNCCSSFTSSPGSSCKGLAKRIITLLGSPSGGSCVTCCCSQQNHRMRHATGSTFNFGGCAFAGCGFASRPISIHGRRADVCPSTTSNSAKITDRMAACRCRCSPTKHMSGLCRAFSDSPHMLVTSCQCSRMKHLRAGLVRGRTSATDCGCGIEK